MYFASRVQAGRMLASRLTEKYRYENCTVLAVNNGGVVVGAQIASQLHCVIGMMLSSQIMLPRENDGIGSVTSDGLFTYNSSLSRGEIEDMESEYRGFIEEHKIAELHQLNRMVGRGDLMRRDLLNGHNIILVSDGMRGQSALAAAEAYLKPIKYEKLIVATPMADVSALDKIHVMADEIQCLSVVDDTFELNHYYDNNEMPSQKKIIDTIENIILHWR